MGIAEAAGPAAGVVIGAGPQRLRRQGVRFHMRRRWLGFDDAGRLRFATPDGEVGVPAAAVVLALGGASWPRLGSDGAWVPLLEARGVVLQALQPSNCG